LIVLPFGNPLQPDLSPFYRRPKNQIVASGLGWIYSISDRRTHALKIAKEFRDFSSHGIYVGFYFPAVIYAGLDDRDEAFRLLQRGYE